MGGHFLSFLGLGQCVAVSWKECAEALRFMRPKFCLYLSPAKFPSCEV